MQALHNPNQNQLLAALPPGEFETLAADLELVPMLLGDRLYEPGKGARYAYFPTTAVVSLFYITVAGESAETAGVGRDGMVGIALLIGFDTTPSSAIVVSAGHGYRLSRHLLVLAFERAGPLQRALLRYTQALMTQIAQTAACYRRHFIEQQVSRWLLSTSDRIPGGGLMMTQELVAGVLGVRRESITEAAGRLQNAGFVRYRRGHISILDPIGLQSCACECYAVVKKELNRLLRAA